MKKIVITIAIILLSLLFTGTVFAITGTVNTDGLNLRDGASTTGTNVLVKIYKNSELDIVEEQGDWYKVNFETYSGYVSKQYVDKKEETSNTTSNETSTENNSSEPKAKEDAIVYVLPLINSSKISEIKKDEKVTIISEVGKWKYIQTSLISGWVLANKIEGSLENNNSESNQEANQISEENTINDTSVENTTNNENKVDETSTNLTANENTTISNETTENTTTSENNTNSSEENNSDSESFPMTLYVNVDAVNVRDKPNTTSDINDSAEKNDTVKVTGESGEWYQVEVNGVKGFIMKKYLSKSKQ